MDRQITSKDLIPTLSKVTTRSKILKELSTTIFQLVKWRWIIRSNKTYLHAAIQHPFTIRKCLPYLFFGKIANATK
jgi:hypothetical protein